MQRMRETKCDQVELLIMIAMPMFARDKASTETRMCGVGGGEAEERH